MKLRTFKNKSDQQYYFELISEELGKVYLLNRTGFKNKLERKNYIMSFLNSIPDKTLYRFVLIENEKYKIIYKNKFGKTIENSKPFSKTRLKLVENELFKDLDSLKDRARLKLDNPGLLSNNKISSSTKLVERPTKKEKMKKERKTKADKVYLKKGLYTLNDIYYDIFLSSNGRHYFSFVNNQGRTVLLSGDIKGFETLEEAESAIEQVLVFAQKKENFEIKTAKDGKFFFNLYNDKKEKIAKSFFFRKREDIESSLNEFLNGNPSVKTNRTSFIDPTPVNKKVNEAEVIPIRQNTRIQEPKTSLLTHKTTNVEADNEADKKRKEERLLADKKWKEEKRQRLIEKEKKAKEVEILLAAKKEKRKAEKIRIENERLEAVKLNASKDSMKDDDLFGGCFKWLWIIFALILLGLAITYFKGCFGNGENSIADTIPNAGLVDSLDNANVYSDQDTIASNNDSSAENSLSQSDNNASSESNNTDDSNTNNNGNANSTLNNDPSNSVQSDGYQNSIKEMADCGCKNKAIFDIPNSAPKKVNKLGSNPQFGNTHGLSAADFMEELKYRYQNNSWDRSYLNYVYKAMGYKGFKDAKASQFSQEKLKPGTKGILGFGSYSGHGYYQLDLKDKDLEVFRIEASNGCHINFMKTCGNLFFTCQ